MATPKKDIFGKWAWPNFRSDEDSLPPEAQQEPDTPEENAAFDALHDLVRKNVPLAQSDASNLKAALQSGQYDAVQPPSEMFVYRGMSVSDEWLRTALKLPAGATLDREGSADGSFTFTPRKGESTSWTLNQGRAEDFAFASITSKLQYAVMMTAPVDPENMLAGPGGFYAVETLDAFPEEEEVVCIGPVAVATIEWMKKGLCRRVMTSSGGGPGQTSGSMVIRQKSTSQTPQRKIGQKMPCSSSSTQTCPWMRVKPGSS